MNYFSIANPNLNQIFGEIVSARVNFYQDIDGEVKYLGFISWKRKNAAVPASTNAFHMHRGLCGAFGDLNFNLDLSSKCKRNVKTALKLFVSQCYESNILTNQQSHGLAITFFESNECPKGRITFDTSEIR